MEKLSQKETENLDFKYRGKNAFNTPIRKLYEDLKVGESVVFTSSEWNEYYKTQPSAAIMAWKNRGKENKPWKISLRTLKKEIKDTEQVVTYCLIRTE